MEESARDVFDSIFASDTGYDEIDRVGLEQAPSYGEVFDFATILANKPNEEEIQQFIRDHPRFLSGLDGWGDDQVLAIIPKPSIGGHYFADFGVLIFGQGGCVISLVELEPADAKLFTRKLSPARRYQDAITQIQNWQQWINQNIQTFVQDTVNTAKSLKKAPERNPNGGFRTKEPDIIDQIWRSFEGFSDPNFQFTIIIGRWSHLTEKERARLISLNNKNRQFYKTYTYDQMIRRGIERPFGHW